MRVATFNILHGRAPTDGRVDIPRYADAIAALDADILALQEVDRGQERSHGADLTAVAADAMAALDQRFLAAIAGTPGATWLAVTGEEEPVGAGYGVALLSRYSVRRWFDVRLPALPSPVPMRAARGRLALVRDEPRVGLVAEVEAPRGPLLVVATHLSFIAGWNQVQLRRLVQAVDALPSEGGQLLMGDLNTPRPVAARRSGWRPLVRARTFPAMSPDRQLDHVLGRGDVPAVTGQEARVMPLSDHRALIADIASA